MTDAAVSSPETDQTPESDPAERVFSKSVVISGIRCTLTYVIFPFVAPLIGITASVGAVAGILIGVVAVVFNVLSIRRFFAADHPYKWWASAMNLAVIVLLAVLFLVDSQTLLAG
ncbi:MAG: hypothetical protein HKN94_07515 [Acidimicrobiales bacterium]|nr:hypothetical protein [Acidimicrobiales bacterium]RZV48702.1 MAG: hypothetical protein EX269_00520 [Acidimicrobiales bacterium]